MVALTKLVHYAVSRAVWRISSVYNDRVLLLDICTWSVRSWYALAYQVRFSKAQIWRRLVLVLIVLVLFMLV
jgi:hypothetical protein